MGLYPGTALWPAASGLYPEAAIGEMVPTVLTGGATNITSNSATVAGSANPEGMQSHWYVEYGPTVSYGLRSPGIALNIGNGTIDVALSRNLYLLDEHTSYHYRFVAYNGVGFGYGADGAFTTDFSPLGPHDPRPPRIVHEAGWGQ